jgi:hypothetical protein
MSKLRLLAFAALAALAAGCAGTAPPPTAAHVASNEEIIGRHMVGEAMLAAQFVAAAEKAGMTPAQINAILKDIAANSAIEEFWITDPRGRAYLTNSNVPFSFSPDATKQPQASAFWPLMGGNKRIVVQGTQKREIDNRVFKYVGVSGVDKRRIVQVGVSADSLPK